MMPKLAATVVLFTIFAISGALVEHYGGDAGSYILGAVTGAGSVLSYFAVRGILEHAYASGYKDSRVDAERDIQ